MNFYQFFFAMIPVVCCIFAARGIIHYFQLESYQFPGYFRTLLRNKYHAFLPGVFAAVVSLMLKYVMQWALKLYSPVCFIACVLVLVVSGGLGILISKLFTVKKAKKKLVFTPRVKRLYVVGAIVQMLFSLAMVALLGNVIGVIWPLILPLVVALYGLLAWPIEKLISECYFRDARRKLLSNENLLRIGITGSYGKTTVKHILGTILAEKYPLLYTPASFNTPMGVTKTIREKLNTSHRIFIGEMGARHVGDIKELCRLVHPTVGLITSVGPQHLETFHSIERVASTKYELIESLPQDGSAYFWDDGAYCTEMYKKTNKQKTLCGTDPSYCDCWYDGVKVDATGSSFTLHFKKYGEVQCHTKLLGEHNIQNILLASACALDQGLSLKQLAHGIEKLQPVQHRLQILHNPGSFVVIDDAFNTNPVSSKASLRVLGAFEGRKIIITPGMVQLGEKEAEYNREFGRNIAGAADIAIIIGKNRALPIIEGLKEAGFPEENIHRVDSLDESTKLLHSFVTKDDIVLYENDLPDHYQEA